VPSDELIDQIDPAITLAYENHMTTRRGQREPLYPPTVLARAADVADRDPLA